MSFDVNNTHPSDDKTAPASAAGQDEDFQLMLAAYEGRTQSFSEGEVIKGRVIAITGGGVIVDVGFKSEGIIPIEQFKDEQGRVSIKVGDRVDVFLEQTEDSHGYVVLSREKAERMKIWDEIERAYRDGSVVKGRVIERIKGGLAVDIGVRAFLPGSQIDLRPVRNLDSLRGEEFEMRVIKVNKKRGNIVLSRKAVLEESMKEEKAKTMEVLEDGKVMDGVVKNITDYGAFIDLGGVDGLLHITDMSWGRVNHPSELFAVGDKVKVKVIKFNREDGRVSLGYKQLTEDPWLHADMRYPKNMRVQGKVVSLTDYGAFVELEPGIEGLIHISEMTWNKRVKHPSKIVSVGRSGRSRGAGHRHRSAPDFARAEADRAQSLGCHREPLCPRHRHHGQGAQRHRLRRLHRSRGRHRRPGSRLRHVLDQAHQAPVGGPQEGGRRPGGHPQHRRRQPEALSRDQAARAGPLGRLVQPSQRRRGRQAASVVRMTNFGAFVELEEGIEGLCHVSELDEKHVEKPTEFLNIGQEVDMKIIKLNLAEKKIGLSLKAMKEDEPRLEFTSYMASADSGNISLGDRFGDQLQRFKKTD